MEFYGITNESMLENHQTYFIMECQGLMASCLQHSLQGHVSDVNTCSFFPSGAVVLSGSADLRLKIWSAEDGTCPATLTGHGGGQEVYSISQLALSFLILCVPIVAASSHFHMFRVFLCFVHFLRLG